MMLTMMSDSWIVKLVCATEKEQLAILIHVRRMQPMVLAPKSLDVNLNLLVSIVMNVKLDILETNVMSVPVNTSKVVVSVNHVVVMPMAVKIMSVTLMGFVIASLDMLEPNVILVNQDSMTQMEVIRMKRLIALNASVTLMVP
jgi:hypothetical protein